jgi:hypothetical protein
MAETRSFTVDPAILFSIIHSQAGTLAKAMLEAVMNAIDAGATKCDITLSETQFICQDNGRGFASREEIINWFERFGTPHKEGDATYGRFRMGRGQMMAFGATVWQTGEFKMVVDIKGRGLDYDLAMLPKPVKGCQINGTLYTPLSLRDLNTVITELEALVAYAQIPVKVNGKTVSKDPKKLKWDIETEDAYIKVSSSNSLKVYNLGVLVREYGSYRFGTGGVVVSKRPLEVNFARNDILEHSCSVWKGIRAQLSKLAKKQVAKKATLNDSEREFLARSILAGDMPADVKLDDARVITVATGVHVALDSLVHAGKVCLAPSDGDRLAERLHRAKVGFVIAPRTLTRFGVETLEELLSKLEKATTLKWGRWPEVVPFATVAGGYTRHYNPVADKDANPEELRAIRQLRRVNAVLGNWLNKASIGSIGGRDVRLGESDAALAWTDGQTMITVERRWLLRTAKRGLNGWFQIMMVMLHEYCHTGLDMDGHEHPQEFYEAFEELACDSANPIAELALAAASTFMAEQLAAGVKVSNASAASTGRGKEALAMVREARKRVDADDPEALKFAAKEASAKKERKKSAPPAAKGQQLELL